MLSIGDFARSAGVSIRMLRHYDGLGLLRPSYVDPATGYRYYRPELLERANTLVALRELGFSLQQVGELLDSDLGTERLRKLLDERRSELREQIERDRQRLAGVERRLRLLEGVSTMELEFIEKELPELRLLQLSTTASEQSEIGAQVGPMFAQLDRLMQCCGQTLEGPIAWYAGEGDGVRVNVGCCNSCEPAGDATVETLVRAPRAVTTVYRGSMDHIGEAWQALAAHVQQAGLDFAGPCREVYLHTTGPQSEWVTELQQPVC